MLILFQVDKRPMTASISRPTAVDFFLMGLTAIIWGSAFVAIKVAVPETGPIWLAAWRVSIGFLVLLPYAIWRGFVWPASRWVWTLIAITGLFNAVLPFFLISWAQQTIDAGVAALLMGTGPLLALLGSHLTTNDDRMSVQKVFAVALGFAGVATIIGGDALKDFGGETIIAQVAVLGAALCYTISGLLIRKIDVPPIRLGCLVLGVASLALIALGLVFAGPPTLAISGTAIFAVIYLGIVPTGLGQILRFSLIKKVGYSVFALALNLVPVFGIALGALLLGEVITLRLFIALMLVLAGLLVSQMGRPQPA